MYPGMSIGVIICVFISRPRRNAPFRAAKRIRDFYEREAPAVADNGSGDLAWWVFLQFIYSTRRLRHV